ncbi:MAG: hypothetical protein CMJ58_14270 [Planctomycetaceae bacterium]|nr:hypothetical protein [Planctomycetaceae bacterium]
MKKTTVLFALALLVGSVVLSYADSRSSESEAGKSQERPAELLIGKWRDRAVPDDAVIEFAKGGTGSISETISDKTSRVDITWKIKQSFGTACVLVVEYQVPEPNVIKPMTWLIAFDGKDTYAVQPVQNKVVFMDRQR